MAKTYGSEVWKDVDAFLKRAADVKDGDPDKTTTHPVKNVDGGTQDAPEGARSAENTADIKKNIPNSVDAAGKPSTSDVTLTNTTAKPTGEDPSNETKGVKTSPTDPGTSHPAKAGTEKYAALLDTGSEILAAIAVAGESAKQAAAKPPMSKEDEAKKKKEVDPAACTAPAAEKTAAAVPAALTAEAAKKHEAGETKAEEKAEEAKKEEIKKAELAGKQAAQEVLQAVEKQAAFNPQDLIAQIVKTANTDAENVVEYFARYAQIKAAAMQKRAEGEEVMPMGPQGAGAGPAVPPEALAAAAGGGAPQEAGFGGCLHAVSASAKPKSAIV